MSIIGKRLGDAKNMMGKFLEHNRHKPTQQVHIFCNAYNVNGHTSSLALACSIRRINL